MLQADKMNFSTHFMLLCFQFTVKFMNNEIEITRHCPKHQQTFLHSSNINFIQFPTNVVLSVCIFYTGIHGPGLTVPGTRMVWTWPCVQASDSIDIRTNKYLKDEIILKLISCLFFYHYFCLNPNFEALKLKDVAFLNAWAINNNSVFDLVHKVDK